MPAVTYLMAASDLDQVLAGSAERPLLLFKHSTTCPISARAHSEWERFLNLPEAERVTLALVRVIEQRPISLAFAQRTGVHHESPQAILVQGGLPVWSASHYGITASALQAAVTACT